MEIYEYRIIPFRAEVHPRETNDQQSLAVAKYLYEMIMQQQGLGFEFYRIEHVESTFISIKMSWEHKPVMLAVFRSRRS
jgi:hypothetical protein